MFKRITASLLMLAVCAQLLATGGHYDVSYSGGGGLPQVNIPR